MIRATTTSVTLTRLTTTQVALAQDLGADVKSTTATWPNHPTFVLLDLADAVAALTDEYTSTGSMAAQRRLATARSLHTIVQLAEAMVAPYVAGLPHPARVTGGKVALFDACPKCGFAFTTPQAACKAKSACAKRAAASTTTKAA